MKTKIIVTVGPASDDEETLKSLVQAGASVFRLNMSHGNIESHEASLKRLKKLQKSSDIQILLDTKGPEIRIGKIEEPLELKEGDILYLSNENACQSSIQVDYRDIADSASQAKYIVLDGGKILLKVLGIEKQRVKVRVCSSGILTSFRHVNIPGVHINLPILTDSDKQILTMAQKYEPDYVAASFIRNVEDIHSVRSYLSQTNIGANLISKIEHAEAMKNIEAIIPASDEIMVARGDLAVETPWYKVPVKEERLIKMSREAHKPVIIATQMLSSMEHHMSPTRAEVMDMSIAVQMGADALMLSDETAVGEYPVKAVEVMHKVAEYAEGYLL
ncbi:pyruvate kinase [Candidatus Peregrinibacteria bacterium]|jgi:pyruvate kinase|nr:pyruvate kinase [Candidatus Peregrinibacteria bacterium]